jgi:hypothetical protein
MRAPGSLRPEDYPLMDDAAAQRLGRRGLSRLCQPARHKHETASGRDRGGGPTMGTLPCQRLASW